MFGKRTLVYLICLGSLFMGAVLGWTGIMRKLADAEAKEIELAETDLLKSIVARFELRTRGAFGGVAEIGPNHVRLTGDSIKYEISGHRQTPLGKQIPSSQEPPKATELDYDEIRTVDQLLGILTDVEVVERWNYWGNVIDGRDQFGVLLMRLSRIDEQSRQAVYAFLREGVGLLVSNAGEVNPGFGLLIISELEKSGRSRELELLRTHFEIKAVDGQVMQLQEELDLETLLGWIETPHYELYLTKEQAEKLVGGGSEIELSVEGPEERAWVRVSGLRSSWSHMSLDRNREGANVAANWRALTGWTVVALVGFIAVIVFMAWQSMRTARARLSLAGAVAHELRTPLAGQRVVLELLEGKARYDAEYVGLALRENERLSALSDEFLTFSRLERGVLELQLEQLCLSDVIGSTVEDFLAQHTEGELVFAGGGEILALADAAAVSTIVRNLLENAWKYSEIPRRVEVSVFERDDEVGFEVGDHGVGLSAKEQKRIFRQFYRVEQKLSRSQDGLGIGLSIVKRLVAAMEGRIEVESEKGRGSTFRVLLKKGGEV